MLSLSRTNKMIENHHLFKSLKTISTMKKLLTLFVLLPFMAVNSYGQYAQLGDLMSSTSVCQVARNGPAATSVLLPPKASAVIMPGERRRKRRRIIGVPTFIAKVHKARARILVPTSVALNTMLFVKIGEMLG